MNHLPTPKTNLLKYYLLLIPCLLMMNLKAQDWKWKNPTPTGQQLNDVKMVDSSIAYAVGKNGTILKTTNGGRDWQVQASNTSNDLTSISVISKDTVYVSGLYLTVLKTTDGGATWLTVRNAANIIPVTTKVFFVNSSVGYLSGSSKDYFFKTTDGGKTWTMPTTDDDFQGATSLWFTSAETGYASVGNGRNGVTLKTTDGGVNWRTIALPLDASFNSVVFTDRQTGYMAGRSGEILKTQDAGESWQILYQDSPYPTYRDRTFISFTDPHTGYIAIDKEILKTTDGGNKWEIAGQVDFDLQAVSFADPLHGICIGNSGPFGYPDIISTSNGGINWNKNSAVFTINDLYRVKFVNPNVGYAVGVNYASEGGFILKTTDAGNTWSVIHTWTEFFIPTDLALPDEKTIYIMGSDGLLYKSENAGATWQQQMTNTAENLNGAFFLDAQTGFVVGDNQTILKTTNGGATWTSMASPAPVNIYSAWFKDHNTGFMVAADWKNEGRTVLLTTTDGGQNWQRRPIGTMKYPRKIIFVNEHTAFILGLYGEILKTMDGGTQWEQTTISSSFYTDMFFTSEKTGYMVGEYGDISMTENGGTDWTSVNSGTNKDLFSIFFTDVNTGYAVGKNGTILKTTNSGSSLKALRSYHYNVCVNTEVLVQPNFIGGTKPLTYLWSNGQTTPTATIIPPDGMPLKVTVTDAEMNQIQLEVPIEMTIVFKPEIRLEGNTLWTTGRYGALWYRNDTLLSREVSKSLVPTLEGDYYSMIPDYSCKGEKSNVIHIYATATQGLADHDLRVYPNPASSLLTVERPQSGHECLLVLTNVQGKEVVRQKTTEQKVQLTLSHLPQGTYFLQLISNNQLITRKVLKK